MDDLKSLEEEEYNIFLVKIEEELWEGSWK